MKTNKRTVISVAWLLVLAACSSAGSQAVDVASPAATDSVDTVATSAETAGQVDDMAVDVDDGAESAPAVLVVRNGTLVDGTGGAPIDNGAVVIEDGVIVAAGAESELDIPPVAQTIDARHGTILPGLVDTHVHNLNELVLTDGELDAFKADLYLTSVVRSGVTTFRDLGSAYGKTASVDEIFAAIDALGSSAPRVVLSGPIIAHEDNWAVQQFPEQAVGVADAESAATATNRLLDNGVDQIKIMVENAEFTRSPTPSLTAEQIAAIVDAAHARTRRVVAHVSDLDEARLALSQGVDELTHWPGNEPLPADLIEELAASGTPVGTTFGILRPAERDLRRLLDAGGTIVVSSDAPGVTSQAGIARELARMADAGMTSMEVVVAATADGARALELDDRIGTLEVGKHADVIVVAGDPLTDIDAMADVTHVVVRGDLAFDAGDAPG